MQYLFCYTIYTLEYIVLLFLCFFFFFSGTLWFKYGLLKGDPIVIYVNLAGAVLSFFYITVFYRYSIQKVMNILLTGYCVGQQAHYIY